MIILYSHWDHARKAWCGGSDHTTASPVTSWTTQRLIDDLHLWAGSVDFYEVRDVSEAGNQPGYYVLFAGHVHEIQQHPDFRQLSSTLQNLIQQGSLKLLFFYVHETFDHWSTTKWSQRLLADLDLHGITAPGAATVVLGTHVPDLPQDPRVRWIYYPWFAGMTQHAAHRTFLRGPPEIVNSQTKYRRWLSLGGRTKPHRLYLLKYLEYHDLMDHGIVTFDYDDVWDTNNMTRSFAPGWQESYEQIRDTAWPQCHTPEQWTQLPDWIRDECRDTHGFDPESTNGSNLYAQDNWASLLECDPEFEHWLEGQGHSPRPGYISVADPFTNIRKGWFGANRYYRDIGWDIVQETKHYIEHGVFLTEKTWRPMVMGVPFVINGCQHSLRVLQDLGYETFHGIIDETYDTLANPMARLQALVTQIQRLCTAPESWWQHIEPRVRHNQRRIWQHLHGLEIHDLICGS